MGPRTWRAPRGRIRARGAPGALTALPTTPLSQWGLVARDGDRPFRARRVLPPAMAAHASARCLLGSAAYAVNAFAVRYIAAPALS